MAGTVNAKSVLRLGFLSAYITFSANDISFRRLFIRNKNKLNFHVCCFFRRFSLKFTKRFAQLIEGRDRHHIRLKFCLFHTWNCASINSHVNNTTSASNVDYFVLLKVVYFACYGASCLIYALELQIRARVCWWIDPIKFNVFAWK